MKDNLDFKIVNKKEYLAKAGVSSKYRNIIESIENIEDDEIILVECNKSEIVSIMSSINHYFGRGIYGYKTIPSTEKRIIFNKEDK
jgi:hypothetical protein